MRKRSAIPLGACLPVLFFLAACGGSDAPRNDAAAHAAEMATSAGAEGSPVATPPADMQPQAAPDMRIEVNLAQRQLHVYKGGEQVASHPVAVGSAEWPTPTGEWTIDQVIWNPRWIPPKDESWAEDAEIAEPGDPENPLGRAQLVYRAPNSIHGTIDPESLGKAVSHGSIRVANEVALELARQVMEAGDAGKDESWYREARENRTERREVLIPNPVPIRVVEGDTDA